MTRLVMFASCFAFACSSDLRTEPIDGGDGDGGDVNVTVTVNNNFGPTTTTTDTTSTTTSTTTDIDTGLHDHEICVGWFEGTDATVWANNWTELGWFNPDQTTDNTDPLCVTVSGRFGDLVQINGSWSDGHGCADDTCYFAAFSNPDFTAGKWNALEVTVDGVEYGFNDPQTNLQLLDLGNEGDGGDPDPAIDAGDAMLFKDNWTDNGVDFTGVGLVIGLN
jgi:hypothetical protein